MKKTSVTETVFLIPGIYNGSPACHSARLMLGTHQQESDKQELLTLPDITSVDEQIEITVTMKVVPYERPHKPIVMTVHGPPGDVCFCNRMSGGKQCAYCLMKGLKEIEERANQ